MLHTQYCIVIYITRHNSGIEKIPIIIDQQKRPHGRPVANPCIRIVDVTNKQKNSVHKRYDGVGKSPCDSKIHENSQENAAKYAI